MPFIIDGATDPLELFLGFYSQPSELHDTSPTERITQTLSLLEKATPLQSKLSCEE
jgi:hypothetical protein